MKYYIKSALTLAVTSALLAGCGGDDKNQNNQAKSDPITVTFLHINDHHSHVNGEDITLKMPLDLSDKEKITDEDGNEVEVPKRTKVYGEAGGFPRLITKMNELTENRDNVFKVHAGDAFSGGAYYTMFKYEADLKMMQHSCFDIFALGNHEFDLGEEALSGFIGNFNEDGCKTEVLAANVKPSEDSEIFNKFKGTTIKTLPNGEKVGFIGIDTAKKTKGSSFPSETTQFLDETETAQAEIDALKKQGVHRIVVVSHYGYKNEVKLAESLKGVDVIIGGDSHTLLGEELKEFGLPVEGKYPTVVKNADGDQACVVQAYKHGTVLGELKVTFDKDGKVTKCDGTPHLLLSEELKKKVKDADGNSSKVLLEGQELATAKQTISENPALSLTKKDQATIDKLVPWDSKAEEKFKEPLGKAADDICLARVPGVPEDVSCFNTRTRDYGSDMGAIVAKAFLESDRQSHVAIQNAGGIRSSFPQGEINLKMVYTALGYPNQLARLKMTGAEIEKVLQEAITNAVSGSSNGAYPYAAGLRWEIEGSKIKEGTLEINARLAGDWKPISSTKEYLVVTNNYIAGGQDGYATFAEIKKKGEEFWVDTGTLYYQPLVDYIKSQVDQTVELIDTENLSTQQHDFKKKEPK